MTSLPRLLALSLGIASLVLLTPGSQTSFAGALEASGVSTITVTNLNDGGPGSLRQAINDSAPGDTIDFAVTGTITLTSGSIYIYNGININGPGAGTLAVSGNNSSRILSIYATGAVSISDLTMRDGYAPGGSGGAIYTYSGSTLTLNRVTVRDNASNGAAGGILNNGNLTIVDSTISGNSVVNTENAGGGIFNDTGATLYISGTTIAGNTATNQGGGIFMNGGTATIVNSSISSNTDSGTIGGGAIANYGNLTLNNVTIGGNHANQAGGGLANWTAYGAVATVKNTVIAGNTAGDGGPDCLNTLNSLGHNLVGDITGCDLAGVTAGNLTGVDPKLGPLADNGGPNQTHALLPGSPAIDHGDNAGCPPTDQRGVARPQGTACDIGAFESTEPPVEHLQGDVNCDKRADSVDALLILRDVARLPSAADCLAEAGDVNCDGARTSVDALGVLRYVAHLEVAQPDNCPDVGTPL